MECTFNEFFYIRKCLASQSHASGMAVVNKNSSTFNLVMPGVGNAANIIAVTKHQKWHEPNKGMFHGVYTTHKMKLVVFTGAFDIRRKQEPVAFCFKGLWGEIKRAPANNFHAAGEDFQVSCYMFGHP